MTHKEDLTQTVGEIVSEKLSKHGGIITRDQLRDALQALSLPSTQVGCIKFPFTYGFDMADAIIRQVAEQTEHDDEVLSYREIRESYQRMGALHPDKLLEDVVAHRYVYRPGTIVKDARDAIFKRTNNFTWLMIGHLLGAGVHMVTRPPEQPLQVLYAPPS
jgi:hypothetical protein